GGHLAGALHPFRLGQGVDAPPPLTRQVLHQPLGNEARIAGDQRRAQRSHRCPGAGPHPLPCRIFSQILRTCSSVSASVPLLSTSQVARARFWDSGIWASRRASTSASVSPSRAASRERCSRSGVQTSTTPCRPCWSPFSKSRAAS